MAHQAISAQGFSLEALKKRDKNQTAPFFVFSFLQVLYGRT